jgi:Fic family protein
MSTAMNTDKKGYYTTIEKVTKDDGEITGWMRWFVSCLNSAIAASDGLLNDIFAKAAFWEKALAAGLNNRQHQMLGKLWDDFKVDLTTSKWAHMMKTSDDTALRDINDLIDKGILIRTGKGGKGVKYAIYPHLV